MGSSKVAHQESRPRLVRSILGGAAGGVIVAGIGFGIGLLRAAVLLASGERVAPLTADDAQFALGYVGSFAAAGVVVGACWPWIRRKVVRHLAFYAGGTVFVSTLIRSQGVNIPWGEAAAWLMLVALGVTLGLFGVYFLEHEYPHHAGLEPPKRRKPARSRAT